MKFRRRYRDNVEEKAGISRLFVIIYRAGKSPEK